MYSEYAVLRLSNKAAAFPWHNLEMKTAVLGKQDVHAVPLNHLLFIPISAVIIRSGKTPNEQGLLQKSCVVLPQCEGEILAIIILQLHLDLAEIGETSGPSLGWRYHHPACLHVSTRHSCQHPPLLLFISNFFFFFPTASSPIWYLFHLILTFQTPTFLDPSPPLLRPLSILLHFCCRDWLPRLRLFSREGSQTPYTHPLTLPPSYPAFFAAHWLPHISRG